MDPLANFYDIASAYDSESAYSESLNNSYAEDMDNFDYGYTVHTREIANRVRYDCYRQPMMFTDFSFDYFRAVVMRSFREREPRFRNIVFVLANEDDVVRRISVTRKRLLSMMESNSQKKV